MSQNAEQWAADVAGHAERIGVPGVAAGVYHGGDQRIAVHGVTSVENPLPVDARTMFLIGSTTKTFTATALLRLVDQGLVDLDARVRTYLPELKLADEAAADGLTVLHLLTHTAGFEGDSITDTGEGDDALARYVATFGSRPQLSPPGGAPSYNNAALALAGRVIEVVTGTTYETAVERLLLQPLQLGDTRLRLNEIMTGRYAAGHQCGEDGTQAVFRPWSMARAETPVGGRLASSVADQLAWARFHLGDGRTGNGTRLLSAELLRRMRRPHSGRGQYQSYGLVWKLRDLAGVRVVEHGGAVPGQHSAFLMVPERDYAIAVLTNSHPDGHALWKEIVRSALRDDLGLAEPEPAPRELPASALARYAGTYGSDSMRARVDVSGSGLAIRTDSPELTAQALAAGEQPPDPLPPMAVGLLDDRRYVALGGAMDGMHGEFLFDDERVAAVVLFGRLLARRT